MRLIEWYLGIEPAGSGEAARWALTWGGSELSYVHLAAVLAAAVVLVAFLSWQAAGRGSTRWLRLLALRLGALAVVAVWLGALALNVIRTGLPTLVLMIDTSASMGLEDHYGEHASRTDSLRRPRLSIAREWLTRDDAGLLRELAHRYRLQVYEFSDEARLIGQSGTADDLAAAVQSIADLAPGGNETRPGPCLDQVLGEYRGAPPAAAVVITDGIASLDAGERLSSARQPVSLGVPVYTIPMGSGETVLDLEIYDLQVDPTVFIGDTVAVDVTARGIGLGGRQAAVELQNAGQSAPLDRTTIEIPGGGQPSPVRLSLTPEYEGDYELIVAANPFAEELNRDNNVLRRRVRVRPGRLKVLLVERAPRWEYRHLKAVLERDPNIEVRTVLQESDLEHQREDRTALGGFPATRDDLFAYDVLVIGDIDLQYLNPGALELIRDFVGTRGGGLILIAGDRHNPSAFQETPLEPLIPVELNDAPAPPPAAPFHVLPATAGADHPLLRIDDGSRTASFWERLPMLNWSAPARVRAPGGVEIAARGAGDARAAVIVLQRFGAGQVLFHATDELWRWRKRVEDRYYGRYWRQAVRFVCRAERLGQTGQMELTTDRATYQQGDAVRFRLRAYNAPLRWADDAPPTLSVEREGGATQTVALAATLEGTGEFSGVLPSAASGAYHARLTGPAAGGTAAECEFSVEVPRRELQQQASEIQDLRRAARETNGIALAYDEVATLPVRLPRGETTAILSSETVAIWARGEWLLVFVGLLAAEWLLRHGR